MAIAYSLTKYKDAFTLFNQSGASFSFILNQVTCGVSTPVTSGTLTSGNTIDFSTTQDGSFELILSATGQENVIVDFRHYPKLLSSFISNAEDFLCGCKCSDCDCEDNCETTLITLTKGLAYFNLNKEELDIIMDCVNSFTSCNLEQAASCLLSQEYILGTGTGEQLIRNLIISFYLAFYFHALNTALDAEEEAYIKTKFKSSKILQCINKYGINVDAILCNPPVPAPTTECKSWNWSLLNVDGAMVVSIKYFDCDNKEQNITDTVNVVGRSLDVCTNGTQPIINIGTLTSTDDICSE